METRVPMQEARRIVEGLNRTMQYGNRGIGKRWGEIWLGLNRTMQYGNFFSYFALVQRSFCLNRTMQYGNRDEQELCVLVDFGLNRTMQYGNQRRSDGGRPCEEFKSYYVVWKLFGFFATKRASAVV